MSKAKYPLIDIPIGDGVHTKVAGSKKEKYVYKYTSYFRNAEGKPRNTAVLIGKVDTETGKMRPNSNYYEIYNISPEMPDVTVWDYGYSYLAHKCFNDIGLTRCLQDVFGDKAMDIMTTASYVVKEGSTMNAIDEWLERTLIPGYSKNLSSQSTSSLFESISPSDVHEFFRKWVNIAKTSDNVCYDVTSVSSYSRTMSDVECGYNRDGENLPQFNLGVFCDEGNKLPLYYCRYNGSLTDKSNLPQVLENAGAVGLKDIKFVLDGGFISEDCIHKLKAHSKAFTIGIPSHLDAARKMIEQHSGGIEKFSNKLLDNDIYCIEDQYELYGISGRLMLFYDPMSHAQLCNEISERIRFLSDELRNLKRYPENKLSRYSKYFIIKRHTDDDRFDFTVDTEKIDRLCQQKGFFLIFTTDKDSSHDDILYHYRAKDAAEKLFDQLKVDMEGARIRTHNEKTTNGKIFVLFLALIIRTYMLRKLKKQVQNPVSLKKVINKLTNISVIVTSGKARFTKALTKEQKLILSAFSAKEDILKSVETCIR